LSTIRNVVRIIVLKDGRIVEQGGYDELKARGSYFSDLLSAQSGEA
jgi:ATP-binding cassette subfamily B multidrug efflux pump